VLEAADRGAGLVAQLMAFARKQELDPAILDVNEFIDSYQSFLPQRAAPLIFPSSCTRQSICQRERGQNAISNGDHEYCLNSRDAMPDGGTLTMRLLCKRSMPSLPRRTSM